MAEFKVIRDVKAPGTKADRIGKFDRLIVVELGPNDRELFVVPDETFSTAELQKQVKARVEQRGQLLGKTFQV